MNKTQKRQGRQVSEKTKRIIELRNSGMKTREIAEVTGYTYTSVGGVIHNAIKRGECNKYQFGSSGNAARKRVSRLGVRLGSIQEALAQEATADIQYWIARSANKGGYKTMAEFLVDLAIDAYFDGKGQGDE